MPENHGCLTTIPTRNRCTAVWRNPSSQFPYNKNWLGLEDGLRIPTVLAWQVLAGFNDQEILAGWAHGAVSLPPPPVTHDNAYLLVGRVI